MAVRRDSLRARSDFFSPMTGNTSGTRFAGERRGSYTEEAKRRLQDLDTGRTDSPVIEAIKVALEKTPDPFTKIPTKKSYAPEEDQGLAEALGGLGGSEEEVVKAVGDFIEPIASGGSGQRAAQRRADQQYARQEKNPSSRTSTNELVARDNRMYGNTFPKGSMGSGSQPGPAVDTRMRHSEGTSEDQPSISKFEKKDDPVKTRTYYGQGGLALGTTTQRQGGTIKDGKKVEKSDSPAVNLSNYQDNRDKQNALRTAAAQQSRLSDAVKATGIPTGLGLKAGSFGISQAGRDQAAINKGIKAAIATGIPSNVAVQGGAMSQAARDQAAINKGIKAAEATGIPSGDALKAGSFGISEAGRTEAAKNKAMAKAKAQAATKTSTVSTTTKQGVQRTKAQMAAAKRKASGTTSSQAKAANKASMKAAAAARHASFKKAKAAGTHARTASAQRARNKAAAKARAKAAAKKRRSKKSGKKGGGCPDPMMLILMANGSQKRAGDLKVGDLIKTNHEKDMKSGEYKVEYVNVLNNREKAKFTFEESEIVCSLTHKFYVDNDWKEAKDMKIGDEVSGQKLIAIENVEDGDVVHITVEDAHTYICEGLLSHNKRCDIRTKDDIAKLTDMNLLRDDLANVAYFVKELQETI